MSSSYTYDEAITAGCIAADNSNYPCKEKGLEVRTVNCCMGSSDRRERIWGFVLVPRCPEEMLDKSSCEGCELIDN